jgi:tetratricopeptide (TPR) repeat protein
MKALLLALALALAPAPAPQRPIPSRPTFLVKLSTHAGRVHLTVRAINAPVHLVIHDLAEKAGYTLEGGDLLPQDELVTIDLEDRPLAQTLEYVLGGIGRRSELNGRTIRVLHDPPRETEQRRVSDLADIAWLTALRAYPDHESAPAARLAQGELRELTGNPHAALDHYQGLLDNYPESDQVATALLRSGRLLCDFGRWQEAAGQYRSITTRHNVDELQPEARLGLARCAVEMGEPTSAIFQIEALDQNYPAEDAAVAAQRALVSAMARTAQGEGLEALRLLDRAEPLLEGHAVVLAMKVRAQALSKILPAESARAWVLYASRVGGEEQATALESAATLALSVGDDVSVLFVCREAARNGLEERFRRFELQARSNLGLEDLAAEDPQNDDARVTRAETWLADGNATEASAILAPLYSERHRLPSSIALRVSVAYAQARAQIGGLAEALTVLRDARPGFTELADRSLLDVTAARLLESHNEFTRAIDAYEGRY